MTQEASFDVVAQEGRELTADPKATGEKTFGRQEEVLALARTLASGRSAVLVGPSGVGKTAVVQKLLSYLHEGRLPELAGAKIYEISTVGLCADTRFTGQQEGRIRAMLAHASRRRLHYIPDLWNLPYAGSYSTNPRGIYDLMRPGIEQGKLLLFGEATPGRWDKLTREHPVLLRDFVAIAVPETSEDQTRELLMRVAADISPAFEKQAIDRVFSLAKKFLPTQSFPGKGVELLRRVAQEARAPMIDHAGVAPARAAPIDAAFVEEVFAKQTALPMHMLSPGVRVSYEQMHRFLSERVLGQKEAVSAVADLLALYKTGLNDPERPAGVLLFVGPTGVGKTELAKATAEFLFGTRESAASIQGTGTGLKMLRIDVSEYKDFHSFEKLIGDPKQNKTGLLTDYVRKNPFSVVLLDEFEKGHPNLADLMLQVFDDGRLTDAFGDTVDFRHTIIILTSNVGSNLRELGGAIGFSGHGGESAAPKEIVRDVRRSLEHAYRPEFLNRIDKILVFSPLERADMRRIAQRELGKVYRREGLLERDLLLEVDDGVIDLLLDRGFDPKYGARPLKRAMEELIVLPLARAVLGATSQRYQLLRVARKGDGVSLSFEETESSRKLQNLERRTRVDDGEGHVLRMSLAEVKAALGTIYERLAHLEQKADVPAMRKELGAMEEKSKSPAFWDEAFGKGGDVYRRHRLTVELRRLEDLRERTELLRQLVEASFLEAEDAVASELVGKYVRLERQLARAERELVHFDETDRGDAQLTVRAVGGKEGASAWAKELAQMYAAWAEDRKYDVDLAIHANHAELVVKGPYAYGYLKGEHGGHRLIAAPKGKEQRRGDVFLARVEVKPLAPKTPDERAHKRGAASERRRGGTLGAGASSDDEPPIRTYDQWHSRGVRDRRTGASDGDVKRVLGGKIDAFLEAAFAPAVE